jgi:cytochrome c-type biogenesis protein
VLDVNLGGAFLAGLISFVSPCVLPIVPPYLCFLAGVSIEELQRGRAAGVAGNVVGAALAFVLGFTSVFVAMGATASVIGQTLARHLDTLAILAGIVIIIMGLHFLGLFRIGLLYREARLHVAARPAGLAGAYVVGLAFAFGWTPCIGPVLGAILFVAGSENTMARGATLLAAYSLGIGLPFLAAAAFAGRFLGFASRFRRHMATMEKVTGGLLVVTGVLFMTGQMATFSYWLLETFPAFQNIG